VKRLNVLANAVISVIPRGARLPCYYYYLYATQQLEKELFLLRTLVKPGSCAVDVGANKGIYSYALSKYCSVVEAFEPQPDCSSVITAYSLLLRKNINVHTCGLSDVKDKLVLHIPCIEGRLRRSRATGLASFEEKKYPNQFVDIEVPVHKLDDYNLENVSFIKIDVEGHEMRVINGAKETIVRNKPILLVEIEKRHLSKQTTVEFVIQYIEKLGYETFFLRDKEMLKFNSFASQRVTEIQEGNIYNFIFKPKALT
jgi:FkbM family methyltransferase